MTQLEFDWPGRDPENPAHRVLAGFFAFDIQHSLEWARDLVAQVTAVRFGELEEWERLGNAYRLRLDADGATVEDMLDLEGREEALSLDELEVAARAWLAHVESSVPTRQETDVADDSEE